MADKPKKNLPKVPPFDIPGASNRQAEEPASQSTHIIQAPKGQDVNNGLTQPGIFSFIILVISVVSLGIAMLSGAWFAYGMLGAESPEGGTTSGQTEPPQVDTTPEVIGVQPDFISKVVVVGLVFAVGWVFSAIGVRTMGNLILPYAILIYTWVVLGGILILQVLIMTRLYRQEYHFSNYILYLGVFGAGLFALVALHLLLEKHSLIPYGFIILLASLGHLYTIVYHYIFVTDVAHNLVWGDIVFFFVTTIVSILMMAHFGFLNGTRRSIHDIFGPKEDQFGPPD